MAGRFFGSLFGNGSKSQGAAEQGHVHGSIETDESSDDLATSKIALDALRHDLRMSGRELPTIAYSQFRQIDDLLRALIIHMKEFGTSTEQGILLGAIVSDYLPTSLRTYMMLPKPSRQEYSEESRVLIAQLTTLRATALELDRQVRSGAATELAIHGRFLQDKFDLTSLHLEGH